MDKIHALYLEDSAHDMELIRAQLEADGLPCNVVHARLMSVMQRALAEVEERHRRQRDAWVRSLIENASDLITVINAEGLIRFQSPSLQRVLGYPPANLLGRNVFDLVHPEDVGPARATFQDALAGASTTVTVECRFRHRDGPWRVLQSSCRALPAQGDEALAVINSRDATEPKQVEARLRQAQKIEGVAQLAGSIAHDFNNLLSVIFGHAEVLGMKVHPDEPLRDSVAQIGRAAERAAGLSRQLLALSRQQVLEPQALDLNAVVVSAENRSHQLIGENIRLITRLQPDLSPVRADPGQLDQALWNLVTNARDAMPHGGTLSLETRNVDLHPAYAQAHPGLRPGRYVLLAVTDTGRGLSPEVQARIFEPFSTTEGMGLGTGLGLAAVHGIVEQNGGHMEVYSLPGLGTTFKLYLPTVEQPVESAPQGQTAKLPQGRGERVLLVEDEMPVRGVTALLLENLGYQVLEAGSAEEALQLMGGGQEKVDLLMTDVILLGRNGRQLADALRSRDANLKVLFQSGYTGEAVTQYGIVEPEMAFLQKPFTRETLAKKVRNVLEQP